MSGSDIENTCRFGFFGKLPINGDFIQRDLPAHFIHRWDGWLQENLAEFQHQLQENWLKYYLTSPIWRFFIAPSIIDENAYIGIVGPSVDRVGRYFPMTIATPIPAQHISALFSSAFQATYSELESIFLKYLNADSSTGSISVNTLSDELSLHSANLQRLIKIQNIDHLPESLDSHRFLLSDQSDIAGAISSLWLMQLMEQHTGASLWWSNGSHAFEPSLLVNHGLPNKQQFTSMLSGFNNNYWRQKHLSLALMEKTTPEASAKANLEVGKLEDNPKAELISNFSSSQLTSNTTSDTPVSLQTDYSELLDVDNDSSNKRLLDDFLNDTTAKSDDELTVSNSTDKIRPAFSDTSPFLEQTNTGFSEIGHKREENQDAILIHKSQSMWVVADGMGGHSEGDKASKAIVDQLSSLDLKGDLQSNIDQVKEVLTQVNHQILEFAQTNKTTCGSTVVILIRNYNQCAYLWAGDSRLYLSRNEQLHQLTQDHSIDNGLPQKNNAITRAVGVYEHLDVDCGFHQLLKGDRFLLCSDGVYDSLTTTQLNKALKFASPIEASNSLKQLVLDGPAKDNLSGILVWF